MTLEDFFTLTEIKNGLTALSRVEELLAVMQKEKDCVVKNAGDATRQWAAVASTLSATENKDCLDLFIQLDGLWFINRWLEDAQKFSNDTNDSCVEESISVFLRALEKLHISYEKSISSGIFTTVKNLIGHNSVRVQDSATLLFSCWKPETEGNIVHNVAEDVGEPTGDSNTDISFEDGKPSAIHITLSQEVTNVGNQTSEDTVGEALLSRNSDTFQPEQVGDLKIQTQLNGLSEVVSDHSGEEDRPKNNLASAVVLNSISEDGSRNEENYTGTMEGKPTTETRCLVPGVADEILDSSKLNEFPIDDIQTSTNDRSVKHTLEKLEIESSDMPDPGVSSTGVDAISVEESLKEISLLDDCKDDHAGICPIDSSLASELRREMNNEDGNYSSMTSFKIAGKDGAYHPKVLQEVSNCETASRKHNNQETTFLNRTDSRASNECQHSNKDSEDNSTDSGFSEPILNSRRPKVIKERSDMELEYGIVDALEVARTVAREVEREMVGYRGPCSSSSERISGGGIRNLGSPDSITGMHDEETGLQPKDLRATPSHSTEEYSEEEVKLRDIDHSDAEQENVIDAESSQVTEARHEAEANIEKGPCDFDLNQEVCSDDIDHLANSISAPISVVSVSRPAVVPGLPVNHLQFVGTLGWRGSAATSAFRPPSPRRTSDCDKSLLGNHDTKQRQDILEFDLNVAGMGEEVVRQTVLSSDLHPEEASRRKEEGIGLDLNCISDDGDASVLNLRLEARPFDTQNGSNASPGSSLSSTQPLMRNIDLNDKPFILIDSSEQASIRSSNVNVYRGSKPGARVISIMGTKVEVGRKDFSLDTPVHPNGRAVEHASSNITRTGVVLGMHTAMSYPQAPFFGYNGLTAGPTTPFSTAMYGPSGTIPFMVDSRGGSVVPQILGSTSAIPQPSYSQPPFILNMSDSQSGLNGVRPSHPNFDLNSGYMVDGLGRDLGGSRQFFLPLHNRTVEDQFRANSQPSSSGIGGKRKEPDGGWESYPFSYKHQQPPWK